MAHPILAVLLVVAGVSAAAITVTYTTASTLTTSVTPPPIQFVIGDDTGVLSDYVSAISVSTNKTYLTSTVNGVPEATLTVGSFFKLQNVDNAARIVTLTTSQVSNAFVAAYTLEIYDTTDTLVDTLDLTDASPSAQATIPAGQTYYAKLTLTLGTGAGANNVALSNSLTLSFA